jgi:hypothetical protein
MNYTPAIPFLLLVTLATQSSRAQVNIRGTVYDKSMINGLPQVSISNNRGTIGISDSLGRFSVRLSIDDTIYFSYLNKQSAAFPVKDIPDPANLNISIDVVGPALEPFYVHRNSYYADSMRFRQENRQGFEYRSGNPVRSMRLMPGGQGLMAGASFDLGIFFNRDTRRSKELMQRWLVGQEQDGYVDHRFNKALVRRITGLDSADLQRFMKDYRPGYDFLKSFETDWDYYKYILESSKFYLADQKRDPAVSTQNK